MEDPTWWMRDHSEVKNINLHVIYPFGRSTFYLCRRLANIFHLLCQVAYQGRSTEDPAPWLHTACENILRLFETSWYIKYHVSKASYHIQVPHVGAPKTSHLLAENVVERITGMRQRPMNPHKQRLLAAEIRSATLPKAKDEKKNTGKKPKSSSSSKKKEAEQAADPESSRSAYSKSKREFMEKFLEPILDCQHASIDFTIHAQILSQVNLFSQGWLRKILD